MSNINDFHENDHELDEFELLIKDGLDAAFDSEFISVSDELYNKTLNAIREYQAKEETGEAMVASQASELKPVEENAASLSGEAQAEDSAKESEILYLQTKRRENQKRRNSIIRYVSSIAAVLLIAFVGINYFKIAYKNADQNTGSYTEDSGIVGELSANEYEEIEATDTMDRYQEHSLLGMKGQLQEESANSEEPGEPNYEANDIEINSDAIITDSEEEAYPADEMEAEEEPSTSTNFGVENNGIGGALQVEEQANISESSKDIVNVDNAESVSDDKNYSVGVDSLDGIGEAETEGIDGDIYINEIDVILSSVDEELILKDNACEDFIAALNACEVLLDTSLPEMKGSIAVVLDNNGVLDYCVLKDMKAYVYRYDSKQGEYVNTENYSYSDSNNLEKIARELAE